MNQSDLSLLMEEPPGGHNHGRVRGADGWEPLGATELPDGFSVVETGRGSGRTGKTYGDGDMGMTSHRGVVQPDEYVDADVLQRKVEAGLGFTYEQIRSVYRQGPLSADQRQLRDRIDARLLALSRAGGNMLALARVLGFGIEPADEIGGERSKTMERALARARSAS